MLAWARLAGAGPEAVPAAALVAGAGLLKQGLVIAEVQSGTPRADPQPTRATRQRYTTPRGA